VLNGLPASLHAEMFGDILIVKLCRPEKRNALNDETVLGIEKIFTAIPSGTKAALVCGEGKHFSAGLDLSELREIDLIEGVHHSRMWHRALNAVHFGKLPWWDELHGACVGGGLELAAACHIRVAETSTFYALPE